MRRALGLRRETLGELDADDLAAVAGGAESGVTCPVTYCVTYLTCRTCYSFPNC